MTEPPTNRPTICFAVVYDLFMIAFLVVAVVVFVILRVVVKYFGGCIFFGGDFEISKFNIRCLFAVCEEYP